MIKNNRKEKLIFFFFYIVLRTNVWYNEFREIIIIEEDFTPTDDGHRDWIYITLMKNTEFLNNFFKDHPDIPKRYYPIYLNNLIRVLELNSSRDYQLYN